MTTEEIRAACQAVLAMPDSDVHEFIRSQVAGRKMSQMVHLLNEGLEADDRELNGHAQEALSRLGFV